MDAETTTFAKGNVHAKRNKLCTVSLLDKNLHSYCYPIELGNTPYGHILEEIQKRITKADILVGHNIKFDILWLMRYNIYIPPEKRIWDTSIAEFTIQHFKTPFPSLEDCCIRYELGHKSKVVEEEYWSRGVDTPDIPFPILEEYNNLDVLLTEKLYQRQLEITSPEQRRLIYLQGSDLLVLAEMESNGMRYNKAKSDIRATEVETQISKIDVDLFEMFPYSFINWASNDHLSSVLFGGTIKEDVKEVCGSYKTGDRAGQDKLRWVTIDHEFKRLCEPLKAVKKEGYFATNADTLQSLDTRNSPTAKKLVSLVLQRAKLEKLLGTYYRGIPKRCEENDWPENYVFGQFNQTVAQTMRLSSSKPNLQNIEGQVQEIFVSRYE